jgi:hypothetical protein
VAGPQGVKEIWGGAARRRHVATLYATDLLGNCGHVPGYSWHCKSLP